MIIVTSHGGNVPPMEIVARELRQTHAMAVATTSWTRLTKTRVYDYPEGPMVDIHGGLSETSMMLALYPELVRTDLVEDFASAQTALRQGSAKLGFHMADANSAGCRRTSIRRARSATHPRPRRRLGRPISRGRSRASSHLSRTWPGTHRRSHLTDFRRGWQQNRTFTHQQVAAIRISQRLIFTIAIYPQNRQ
jgi:hypothetical protein